MTENSEKANEYINKPSKWWQWLVVYPSVAIAIVGAIPQYINVFKGWIINVPPSHVSDAESQNKLWQDNVRCTLSLQEITTQENIVLALGTCPSGDVQVNVKYPDGRKIVRWIAFEKLATAQLDSSLIGIHSALAAEKKLSGFLLAQSQTQVICQRRLSNGRLLRRIRDNGTCYDEVIDTYTGKVEERRPASCNSSC